MTTEYFHLTSVFWSIEEVEIGCCMSENTEHQTHSSLLLYSEVDKKQDHAVEKEISEEDLRKREDMEIERLEKLPFSEDVEVEEIDMSAWEQLRLHPLLMKALMKLKFSKPTPIQEACIPAAAFQGKVGRR